MYANCNFQFNAFMSLRLTLPPCVGGSTQAKKKMLFFSSEKQVKFNHASALNFNNYFAKNKSNGEKLSKRLPG